METQHEYADRSPIGYVSSTVDLRVGGRFASRIEATHGIVGFDLDGTYTKIEPQKLIEYTMGERIGVVEFLAADSGVNLHAPRDRRSRRH